MTADVGLPDVVPLPAAKVYVFTPPPGRAITADAAHQLGRDFAEVMPGAKLVVLREGGATIAPIDGTLDAAVTEVRAALPAGWHFDVTWYGTGVSASAWPGPDTGLPVRGNLTEIVGQTATVALRTLATALRGSQP